MSVCTKIYISGIKPKGEKFDSMLAAYQACQKAGVEVPKEVAYYFNSNGEDKVSELGITVPLARVDLNYGQGSSQEEWIEPVDYSGDERTSKGFIIDLTKVPKDIQLLQVLGQVS